MAMHWTDDVPEDWDDGEGGPVHEGWFVAILSLALLAFSTAILLAVAR